jgi:hypothetical protein
VQTYKFALALRPVALLNLYREASYSHFWEKQYLLLLSRTHNRLRAVKLFHAFPASLTVDGRVDLKRAIQSMCSARILFRCYLRRSDL